MKTKNIIIAFIALVGATFASAQGTLVFDQESSTEETFPGDIAGSAEIQFYGTVGQSFTPSLSTVGFIRLKFLDINPNNALGATLVVNLRANSYSGTILGTSSPVSMADGFTGSINFYFATAVPVTPNATYFFETIVQSGDDWGVIALVDLYSNGSFYAPSGPATGNDLWFREGIVIVPEPSASALILAGGGLVALFAKRRR